VSYAEEYHQLYIAGTSAAITLARATDVACTICRTVVKVPQPAEKDGLGLFRPRYFTSVDFSIIDSTRLPKSPSRLARSSVARRSASGIIRITASRLDSFGTCG
jgi:hypothetical protein